MDSQSTSNSGDSETLTSLIELATVLSQQNEFDEILRIVTDLDSRLADGREWICGDQMTLADLMWSVSLFRLKWMGAEFAWSGNHQLNERPCQLVQSYAERLFARPTFRAAIVDWPGIIRSEYVSDYYAD